VFEEKRIDKE